jgi:hypothetical protein
VKKSAVSQKCKKIMLQKRPKKNLRTFHAVKIMRFTVIIKPQIIRFTVINKTLKTALKASALEF